MADTLTGTAAWCSERNHPWATYNPWLDRTFCRCGQETAAGMKPMDWDAKHSVFHRCAADGGPCGCYVSGDRAAPNHKTD